MGRATTRTAKYTANEITQAGANFFGITTEAMAKGVQHVFGDLGEPDAYIKGDEGSGAFVVGLALWLGLAGPQDPRAAAGLLERALGRLRCRRQRLQMLHPGLQSARGPTGCSSAIPGVEGSFYFVAGLGINYQRSGGVTLAPMRTGVGLRAGVNAHYQVYSDSRDWFPL